MAGTDTKHREHPQAYIQELLLLVYQLQELYNFFSFMIIIGASGSVASITDVSVVEVQGDRPRLSYDITNGVVEDKPHLLLEPSSTNLVTFSQNN